MKTSVESIGVFTPPSLMPQINRALELACEKTLRLNRRWRVSDGAPVCTVSGRYTSRHWTQWTQGFQFGNALLCFEMTGQRDLLTLARRHVEADMAEHLTHTGVHITGSTIFPPTATCAA